MKGCLLFVVMFIGVLLLVGTCTGGEPGSDCYSTPGAREGSAQAQRDLERCLD